MRVNKNLLISEGSVIEVKTHSGASVSIPYVLSVWSKEAKVRFELTNEVYEKCKIKTEDFSKTVKDWFGITPEVITYGDTVAVPEEERTEDTYYKLRALILEFKGENFNLDDSGKIDSYINHFKRYVFEEVAKGLRVVEARATENERRSKLENKKESSKEIGKYRTSFKIDRDCYIEETEKEFVFYGRTSLESIRSGLNDKFLKDKEDISKFLLENKFQQVFEENGIEYCVKYYLTVSMPKSFNRELANELFDYLFNTCKVNGYMSLEKLTEIVGENAIGFSKGISIPYVENKGE